MKPIHRLIYSSRIEIPAGPARADEIDAILASARRHNAGAGITGALLVNRVCFIQVLEGELEAVRASFERIKRDPRHGQLMVLESRQVEARGFPGFSMAYIDATGAENGGIDFLSLAIHEFGLFEALRRQVFEAGRLVA